MISPGRVDLLTPLTFTVWMRPPDRKLSIGR